MPDHTEREREARDVLSNWRPRTSADAAFWEDVDAYRAAVRSAVLAEVEQLREDAARMQDALQRIAGSPLQKALCEGPTRRMEHLTNPCPHCTARKALAALTALEATDGR